MAKCPKCRQWEIKSNDRYCSWCGEKLLAIEVNPLKMRFYIDRDKGKCSHKNKIVMKNSGWTEVGPISMTFDQSLFEIPDRIAVLKQDAERTLEVKLLNPANIEAGKSSTILIDAGGQRFSLQVEIYYTPTWNLTLEGQTVPPDSTQRLFQYSESVEVPFRLDRLDRTVFDIERVYIDGGRHEITENECGKDYFSGLLKINAKQSNGEQFIPSRAEFFSLLVKGRHTEYIARFPFYITLETPPDFLVMIQGKSCKPGEQEELEMFEGIENETQLKIISSVPLHIEKIVLTPPFFFPVSTTKFPIELHPSGDIPSFPLRLDPRSTEKTRVQASITLYPREIKQKKFDFRVEKKVAPEFDGVLAVDFGTTNTTVAYETGTDTCLVPLEISSDPNRAELLASVIRYIRIKDDIPEEYVTGENARSLMIFHPRSTVMSVKTRLGDREKIKVVPTEKNSNPSEFTAIEVTSHILGWLKKTVENHLKKRVTRAVITHPSKFTHIQVQELKTAFNLAGIQVQDTIEEPQATAINYIIQENPGKEDSYVIGVFDCGGGTTDITLIDVHETQEEGTRNIFIKVLATDGDAKLGGNDLTEIMMDILARKINNKDIKFAAEIDDIKGMRFFYSEKDEGNEDMIKRMIQRDKDWQQKVMETRQALWNLAETCKIELSNGGEPEIKKIASFTFFNRNDEPGMFNLELKIKREELESRIKPIIEGFIAKLQRMEKKTGKTCDVVLLSGMSSQIPLFYQSFFQHYGDKVKYADNLKKCVVRGAVEYYDKTAISGEITLTFDRGRKLTSSIGIQKNNREGKREFLELFPQGTDVPTRPARINLPLRKSLLIKVMRNLGTREIIDEAPEEFEVLGRWEIVLPDNITDKALKTGKIYLQVDEALRPKLFVQVGDFSQEYTKEE